MLYCCYYYYYCLFVVALYVQHVNGTVFDDTDSTGDWSLEVVKRATSSLKWQKDITIKYVSSQG